MPKEKEIKRDNEGKFATGTAGGPGRTLGTRDFHTDFDEAVEEFAKEKNITKSKARIALLKVAISAAMDGEFPFFKDLMDRDYGKAKESLDVTTGGEKLEGIVLTDEVIAEAKQNLKRRKIHE